VGSAEASVSIERPADAVWAVAGDFGGLAGWMPGVESCRVEGDNRILQVMGMEITEKQISRDDVKRVLEYSITESPLNAESHFGRVTVNEDGDRSRVTWFVEVVPDGLVDVLAGTYQQALDQLKSHLEGDA
jgi:carbon monoxide dehydrogenase subunit G